MIDAAAIGALSAVAVFLLRKSANMPQLNNDGPSGFSAPDLELEVAEGTPLWSARPGPASRRCCGCSTGSPTPTPARPATANGT